MAWPHVFATQSGVIPASQLDDNFNAAAFASDLTALTAVVTALPSNAIPQAPVGTGAAGAATTFARSDHVHPVQGAVVDLVAAATYTIAAADNGKVVELNFGTAIAVTVPNTLPANFSCMIAQVGAGQVTVAPAVGATQRQRQGLSKTAGQWSVITFYVRANSGGTAAEYVLSGDLA